MHFPQLPCRLNSSQVTLSTYISKPKSITISVSTARSTDPHQHFSSVFKASAPYPNSSKIYASGIMIHFPQHRSSLFFWNPYIWICFSLNPLSFHLLQILCTIRSLQQLAKIFRLQLPSAGAARCRATAAWGLPGGRKEGEGCEAPSNQHQAKANLQVHGENQKWIQIKRRTKQSDVPGHV